MTHEERREELRQIGKQMAEECFSGLNADPQEIIIRYTGKLAVLREQWRTEDKLKARFA